MLRLVLFVPILIRCNGAAPTGREQRNPGTALQDTTTEDAQEWAGTISFDDSRLATVGVPLNVTVTGQSAAVTWYFTGENCREQYQPAMVFSTTGNTVTLLGCGGSSNCSGAENFYTLAGNVTATGEVNGTVYHPPYPEHKQRVGTFAITKVSPANKQQPPQCRGHGPMPAPPPPPAPTPKPHGPNPPALWPAPAHYHPSPSTTGSVAIIDPMALSLDCSGCNGCETLIGPAVSRAKDWALAVPDVDFDGATLKSLVVNIEQAQPLQFGVNESYMLEVTSTCATIEAPTQWGALYGIESFFQMVLIEPWKECPNCKKYIVQPNVPFTLIDQPRTRWRGLMIDSGRHWLPPTTIKKAIDAMAAAKMNALHWHLTDDQSFPLCLKAQPQLCQLSAYRDHVTGAVHNYTPSVIRHIVDYASARGVRVIPELDLPGHSVGLQRGAPKLYANCSSTSKLPDVSSEHFFDFLDTIIGEMSELFPDKFLHMGGDEVKTDCWEQDPAIVSWMNARNLSAMGALGYFQSRVQQIVEKHGKSAMFWDEFWAADLPALNSTVAEIRSTTFDQLLSQGRPALTTGIDEAWYLDHGVSNPRFIQSDWTLYYSHDPFSGLSPAQLDFNLGGEVDMWGEGVDETNFEPRVFPYASAVAERLWSPGVTANPVYTARVPFSRTSVPLLFSDAFLTKSAFLGHACLACQSSSTSDAEPRLAAFRCMLVRRGVNAAPIGPSAPC